MHLRRGRLRVKRQKKTLEMKRLKSAKRIEQMIYGYSRLLHIPVDLVVLLLVRRECELSNAVTVELRSAELILFLNSFLLVTAQNWSFFEPRSLCKVRECAWAHLHMLRMPLCKSNTFRYWASRGALLRQVDQE